MHIQVIVSRKDCTNKIKLSPMNNSRGANQKHSRKIGQFDRVAFKASGEKVFDEMFDFRRPITESFDYANTQAKSSLEQRIALAEQISVQRDKQAHLVQEQNGNTQKLLREPAAENLLELLLARADFDPLAPIPRNKKRKKRKGQQQDLKI